MFLKSLIIAHSDGSIIRDIKFHQGLNLIIDETPILGDKETGNNVGKTTVLKLIDFCFGSKQKEIYADHENSRNEYKTVKDYLITNKVLIQLRIKEDLLKEDSKEVLIERNFLLNKKKIQRINEIDKNDDEFEKELISLFFPNHYKNKPTFRQLIAHNIRYKDHSLNNTLKNLNPYTRNEEYETLYLFLFGCAFSQGDDKQELLTQIKMESNFKKRLEADKTKSTYESALNILKSEIDELEYKKESLNLNPNFESALNELNKIKYEINCISSEISGLDLRKKLILEAQNEIQLNKSNIDIKELKQIYQQATSLVNEIQKTFEELTNFHNKMVESKIKFITQELPKIDNDLKMKQGHLNRLLIKQKELSSTIIQSDSFEELENLSKELNEKYHTKGEYEQILKQLNDVDSKLTELNSKLTKIDNELFSNQFSIKVKEQITKFNNYFSRVSSELYGEKYALKVDEKELIDGRRFYEFTTFNMMNLSSGKKQGEISCFDIAYTLFAEEENIPCMHFLLSDKKELMHDNQLVKIANLVNEKGIQFVTSILKDKLPEELKKNEYVVLKLSQKDKLFKIES